MTANSPVLAVPRPVARPTLRLICLPYAGGSAAIYGNWAKALPADVEMIAVQPPGRANRMFEKPHTRMDALVDELYAAVAPLLDVPYVVFGHSLGSRVGFEIVRMARRRGVRLPEHFIASGSPAPQLPARSKSIHALPRAEFIQELREFNGTPEAVLANEELMELSLPLLRADFMLSETYTPAQEPPLDCTLSVFSGETDRDVQSEHLLAWRTQFLHGGAITMFAEDHFFVDKLREAVVAQVNGILLAVAGDLARKEPHRWVTA